jgi:hypothetical protein
LKTIPFNREHLTLLEPREYEKERVLPFLNSGFLDAVERSLWSYTLVKDGRVVTCIGGLQLWSGVWEVWQIPSVYVHKYTLEYCRTLKGLLDAWAEKEKAWRLQTSSPADELHDRWMEFLGFKCEGTMAKYNRFKIDYRIWSRIWEQMPAQQ